ncbi:cuticle protein 21-like [Aedes albopictus]|uniref:Cuticle protein n=1 Tax=Aedes albopictus TaxID=7160 RepID=A0ABM1ZHT6_AEDAL
MFTKLICIAVLAISCVCAKPGVVAPVAYSAQLAYAAPAPAFVTAQSSQVIARNYNGVAPLAYTAPIAAPLGYAASAPLAYSAAAAPLAYTAPVAKVATPVAYSAPALAAAVPLAYTAAAAAATPFARTFATPYAAPFAAPYTAYPYVL